METFIHNFILWIDSSKYILLFLGSIFEGPILMMTGGFLYHLGRFNFWPMYFVLLIGDFTADMLWYCIGRYGTRSAIFKYGKFLNVTPQTLEKAEILFNKYHQRILIISKITFGLGIGFVILTVAGMFRVEFKKYVAINFLAGILWTLFLISVGYFFGNIFDLIPEKAKIEFLVFLTVTIFIGFRFITNYLKTS